MNLLLSLSCVLLIVLAFPPFGLWWTVWVALVPFFCLLDRKEHDGDVYHYAFLTGFLFYLCSLYFLAYVTIAGFLFMSFYLGFYFALFARLYFSLKRSSPALRLLAVPALWTALEWIRSHLLTGCPWFFLGHSQSGVLPVIQLASFLGPFSVSFVIVLVNWGIYELFTEQKKRMQRAVQLLFVLGIVVVICVYGYARIQAFDKKVAAGAESVKIAVVQGNVLQEMKWDPAFSDEIINRYCMLTKKVSKEKPALIVWPEAAVPAYLTHNEKVMKKIHDLVTGIQIPLVTGAPDALELKDGKIKYLNSAFLISKGGLVMDVYAKIKLVPLGEYIPKFIRKMIPFIGSITGGEEDFSSGNNYTLFYLKNIPFSVMICFEAIFPDLVRKFVKEGARFIVNVTNNAWFGPTGQPEQDMGMNVFSAVSNGVSFVRATNTGISGFIDPLGRVQSVLHDSDGKMLFIEGVLAGTVSLNAFSTLYTKTGDVFSILCILIVTFLLIISRNNVKREK